MLQICCTRHAFDPCSNHLEAMIHDLLILENFVCDKVDIELPEDMYLKDAHEIGEKLQNKLEALPEVERAYVHLDFESTHKPEHPRRPKTISQN